MPTIIILFILPLFLYNYWSSTLSRKLNPFICSFMITNRKDYIKYPILLQRFLCTTVCLVNTVNEENSCHFMNWRVHNSKLYFSPTELFPNNYTPSNTLTVSNNVIEHAYNLSMKIRDWTLANFGDTLCEGGRWGCQFDWLNCSGHYSQFITH